MATRAKKTEPAAAESVDLAPMQKEIDSLKSEIASLKKDMAACKKSCSSKSAGGSDGRVQQLLDALLEIKGPNTSSLRHIARTILGK